jgi:hypothetical protein
VEHAESQKTRERIRDVRRGIEQRQATSKFASSVERSQVVNDQRKEGRLRHAYGTLVLRSPPASEKNHTYPKTTSTPSSHSNSSHSPPTTSRSQNKTSESATRGAARTSFPTCQSAAQKQHTARKKCSAWCYTGCPRIQDPYPCHPSSRCPDCPCRVPILLLELGPEYGIKATCVEEIHQRKHGQHAQVEFPA